jgi:hypothetical protein
VVPVGAAAGALNICLIGACARKIIGSAIMYAHIFPESIKRFNVLRSNCIDETRSTRARTSVTSLTGAVDDLSRCTCRGGRGRSRHRRGRGRLQRRGGGGRLRRGRGGRLLRRGGGRWLRRGRGGRLWRRGGRGRLRRGRGRRFCRRGGGRLRRRGGGLAGGGAHGIGELAGDAADAGSRRVRAGRAVVARGAPYRGLVRARSTLSAPSKYSRVSFFA